MFSWKILWMFFTLLTLLIILFRLWINILSWVFIQVNINFVKYVSYRNINSCWKSYWQLQSNMKFFLLLSAIGFCWAQYAPNTKPGRTSIVHLFEWRWVDIALECERYLAPKGFGGVQVGIVYSINYWLCCAYKWYYDLYLWTWDTISQISTLSKIIFWGRKFSIVGNIMFSFWYILYLAGYFQYTINNFKWL